MLDANEGEDLVTIKAQGVGWTIAFARTDHEVGDHIRHRSPRAHRRRKCAQQRLHLDGIRVVDNTADNKKHQVARDANHPVERGRPERWLCSCDVGARSASPLRRLDLRIVSGDGA